MTPRVCWDTNPLVSAFIERRGPSRQILDLAREEQLEVVVSEETLRELASVLRRPHIADRYGITSEEADDFVRGIREFAVVSADALPVNAVPDDPKDNHVIAAAIETECAWIVTGDKHLLNLGEFEGVGIASPRYLLTHLRQS